MTYTPVIPMGGIGGFAYLQRTRETQQAILEETPQIKRNVAAFEERIGKITSAEDLVNDRQLLQVALGAFGLDDDINNKYLIQKILESDTDNKDSLAARYSDKRYAALSDAFGFGKPFGPETNGPGFAADITARYTDRQFEIAAGEVDNDMRLALSFERDLADVAGNGDLSIDGKWFTVMSNPPLRAVFETALGLPSSIGQIDLDQQLGVFKEKAERMYGTADISELTEPETQDRIIRDFLARSQLNAMMSNNFTSGSAALAILSGG